MTKLGWTLVGLTVIGGVALVIKESQAKAAGPELEGGFGPIPGGTPSLPAGGRGSSSPSTRALRRVRRPRSSSGART